MLLKRIGQNDDLLQTRSRIECIQVAVVSIWHNPLEGYEWFSREIIVGKKTNLLNLALDQSNSINIKPRFRFAQGRKISGRLKISGSKADSSSHYETKSIIGDKMLRSRRLSCLVQNLAP